MNSELTYHQQCLWKKETFTLSDNSKGHSEERAAEVSPSEWTSDVLVGLRETYAKCVEKSKAARSLPLLACAFRQLACSYVAKEPLSHIRYMTLQLLEAYVRDEEVFKGTEAAGRWEKIFGRKEERNKETPNVVKCIDDKADDSDIHSIDLCDVHVRKYLKETCGQLQLLSTDDYCLRFLLEKLNNIILPTHQDELPDNLTVQSIV